MFRHIFWMTWLCVLCVLGSPGVVRAQTDPPAALSADGKPLILPLCYRSPRQKVLLAMDNPREAELAKKFMQDHGLQFDFMRLIDPAQVDYSAYHLVIIGSDGMAVFAEAKGPVAFDPLTRFIADGGHLMVFGIFNGVHCQHLGRFGITTSVNHALGFREIPGRSEVLFNGVEDLVPANHLTRSTGHIRVAGPHVALLLRETTALYPDEPVLATLAYKQGRLTYTQVEPDYEGNLWFETVLLTWALNGAPTVPGQLGQNVELDEQTLVQQRKSPVPFEGDWKSAERAVRDKLQADFAEAVTREEKQKLADRLVKMGEVEPAPLTTFACLQLAKGLYAETASPVKLFDTIRQLQSQFQVDGTSLSVEAAQALAESIHDPVGSAELAKGCLDLADDLADAGRYDTAAMVANLAKDAAQKAKHKHYQSIAVQQTRRLAVLQKESDRLAPFRETLKTDADNPEANFEIGKFQCLLIHDWDVGLPHLTKGSDATFRQLAAAEFKGTDDPNAQAALGDLWGTASGKLTSGQRASARARAKTWYWRAISKSSGSDRMKLERKADKMATEKSELRFSVRDSGQAELHITNDRITWKQLTGDKPANVQLNSQYWPIESQTELMNHGSNRYFFDEVNLETAKLTRVRNQGTIELQPVSPEEVVIDVNGQTDGEFVIKFGQ